MAINYISKIISNKKLSKNVFLLSLDFPQEPLPGQFVMIKPLDDRFDPFLSRPISIFNWENNVLELLIKIVGKGTDILSKMETGKKIRINGPLGNSFPKLNSNITLIGGGIGIAPLFFTAKKFDNIDKIILGFRNKEEIILKKEFEKFAKVIISTDDGSNGLKGNPTTVFLNNYENSNNIFSCGPMVMMESLHKIAKEKNINDFCSLESVMGCGFGACLGCRIDTKQGSVLVCKEGPVFQGKDVF